MTPNTNTRMSWSGPLPILTQEKSSLFSYLDSIDAIQAALLLDHDVIDQYNIYGSAGQPPAKKIWIYWHQGWNDAPRVAKACLESWIHHNRDYDVVALDRNNIADYCPSILESASWLSTAHLSDRYRLDLLVKYGGIWADATLYCSMPIRAWATTLTQLSGFFAFLYPAPDRLLSNWFMVSRRNAVLPVAWKKLHDIYLEAMGESQKKVHHYFFAHYIYEYMIRNSNLSELHAAIPFICVNAAARVAHLFKLDSIDSLEEPATRVQIQRLDDLLKACPVHKLTWKGAVRAGSVRSGQLIEILECRRG